MMPDDSAKVQIYIHIMIITGRRILSTSISINCCMLLISGGHVPQKRVRCFSRSRKYANVQLKLYPKYIVMYMVTVQFNNKDLQD